MTEQMTEQEAIATILVNQRVMRNGAPPISNVLEMIPEKLKREVMDDADAVVQGLNASRVSAAPCQCAEMVMVLEFVLNSDMAMREEDEGQESKVLDSVRSVLAKAKAINTN